MKKNQNVGFQIFTFYASSILPDGWVELKISTCRCHFRAFQVELDILGIVNFVIGSVVEKLQAFEVGWISIRFLVFFSWFFRFFSPKNPVTPSWAHSEPPYQIRWAGSSCIIWVRLLPCFQLREKTAAIDRSRGIRFQSAQELYRTPSRRKVLDV